eukprot:403347727
MSDYQVQISDYNAPGSQLQAFQGKRLMSQTVQLIGHQGEIYTVKFSRDGDYLASAGYDRLIYFWDVFDPECKNFGVLKGHSNAILDLVWGQDNTRVYTASSDRQIFVWDTEDFQRVRKLKGHTAVVNSVDCQKIGSEILVSGSDDYSVKLWDARVRNHISSYELNYQITSVCFNNTNDYVFFGGLDNTIKALNLRKNAIEFALLGHTDTVTGISLSKNGNFLVSNSMDNTVKVWDIRPYIQDNDDSKRCQNTLFGISHNFEKNLLRCAWNHDSTQVTAGSGDRFVCVWDVESGKMTQRLGGHHGSVNEVAFHPERDIIASASSDKTLYLGELQKSS